MSTTIQIVPFAVNTAANKQFARDFDGNAYKTFPEQRNAIQMECVYGDVILLAGQFTTQDPVGNEIVLDMTGSPAIRATFAASRLLGADLYSQRVVFNQGFLPEYEDLAAGYVTWDFNTIHPDLEQALTDAATAGFGYVDIILECTRLTAENLPQTLCQLFIRVHAQADVDAVGTPPPSSPTYMDAATALATFVRLIHYLNPTTVSGGPTALTSVPGIQVTLVDTTGGDETVNLPAASGADPEYVPWIINIGTNRVFVVPDGVAPDNINDINGTQTINTKFGSLFLQTDPANDRYIAPNKLTPV